MREDTCHNDWGTVSKEYQASQREDFWRAHIKKIYQRMLERWGEHSHHGLALKTDLFDESIGPDNLISLIKQHYQHVVGMDIAFEIAATATKRISRQDQDWHHAVVCDVRNLPFRSDSFDLVISTSTLDHFNHKKYIFESLRGICKILKPKGVLIITLDNPSNPIVFLRNFMPSHFMQKFGLVPFPMGVTFTISELTDALGSCGFIVQDSTAIVHSPRIIGIRAGQILARIGSKRLNCCFFRLLELFEHFEKLPLRYVSGYFIAVKAMKK